MFITEETLDDLLRRVLNKLLLSKNRIDATRGQAREETGVLLQVTNPRARLSRTEKKGKLFSSLGELLWYLAGSNALRFIVYYVPAYKDETEDGRTIYGGYGPRLFGMDGNNQVDNVVTLLKEKSGSRRAVIQLFDASDLAKRHKEIPCTCTLQFMIRQDRLHMITSMRSNDAFLGLPHDVFAFTMLQEIMARTLDVDLGTYKHSVGSLHLYDRHRDDARQYLKEGWQPTKLVMPPMPVGDPWRAVRKLIRAERAIRNGKHVDVSELGLDPYWEDIVRLLQIYGHSKRGEGREITVLKKAMSVNIYDPYIEDKKHAAEKRTVKTGAS
jgi:thymidylate synthase